LHPYIDNWKPAWRSLYRVAWAVAAGAASLMLVSQVAWMTRAFVYPHTLLESSIDDAFWTAITTRFYDAGSRGGVSRVWNLNLTERQASDLRAHCGRPVSMTLIEDLPKRGLIIDVTGTDITRSDLEAMARLATPERKVRPKGCFLGSERDREGKSSSESALFGSVLQIEEWLH
jgi:hypothetical protein